MDHAKEMMVIGVGRLVSQNCLFEKGSMLIYQRVIDFIGNYLQLLYHIEIIYSNYRNYQCLAVQWDYIWQHISQTVDDGAINGH